MVSDFCWSWLDEPLVAPLPAVPLGLVDEELGVDDEAPPLDGLLLWSELDEDGVDGEELDGEEPMLELDEEPDGEVEGVDVAPLEDEPEGEDDGLVVDEDDPVAPPWLPRSHAVRRVAPSAMETAIARVDNLIVASVVGVRSLSKLWAGRLVT